MVVTNKTELSTTVCTTVLQLGHEALLQLEVGRACACKRARRLDKKDALPRGFRRNVLQYGVRRVRVPLKVASHHAGPRDGLVPARARVHAMQVIELGPKSPEALGDRLLGFRNVIE